MNAPHVLSVNILQMLPVKTFECPWSLSAPQSFQFPETLHLEHFLLVRTDNIQGQIPGHLFIANKVYCLFIIIIVTIIIGITIMHVLGSLKSANRTPGWSR